MERKCIRCGKMKGVAYSSDSKTLCHACVDEMIREEQVRDFDEWVNVIEVEDTDRFDA